MSITMSAPACHAVTRLPRRDLSEDNPVSTTPARGVPNFLRGGHPQEHTAPERRRGARLSLWGPEMQWPHRRTSRCTAMPADGAAQRPGHR